MRTTIKQRKEEADYSTNALGEKKCSSCCFLNEDALFDKLDSKNNPTICGYWGFAPSSKKGTCLKWNPRNVIRSQIAQHARTGYFTKTGRFK
jgi:hypothetical protein